VRNPNGGYAAFNTLPDVVTLKIIKPHAVRTKYSFKIFVDGIFLAIRKNGAPKRMPLNIPGKMVYNKVK
jgi:hypothetical protein